MTTKARSATGRCRGGNDDDQWRLDAAVSMQVRGADAHRVGDIKDVHKSEVLIHRRLQPTVRVPIAAIRALTATEAVLPQRTPPGRVMAPLIAPLNRPRL